MGLTAVSKKKENEGGKLELWQILIKRSAKVHFNTYIHK